MRSLSPCVLAALVAAVASPAKSGEVEPASLGRLEKQIVPKLVSAVGELGNGRVESALEKFQEMVGRKFHKTSGPFGQDEREVWRKMFVIFRKTPPKFECVDLIAAQAISTQAFKVSLMANGEPGPVLFQFRVFEYRGKFRLANVHFDSNWNRMEAFVGSLKQKRLKRYPLPAEQTAGKSGKTKPK
jgi:hypothetical protein